LDEHKNWPLFLDVAEQLTQMGFEGQFWMVGGETAKPHTVQHLLNEAKRKGVLRRLYWIPRLEYERMPLVYTLTQASGGISLSTSRNESFGMTVLESLACSCPPLAPNVGALGEVLDGELAACLYEPSGAGEIARKVIQLLEDSALRERLVSVGKAKIEQHYTIDSAASLYYQTLLQIIH
jgi:glycosyltransferase involved in cell wall biosynthesis